MIRPLFACLFLLVALPMRSPADEALPDPLSLQQALDLAADHPAVSTHGGPAATAAGHNSLYLDCHSLAFPNAVADPGRSRPLASLLEPIDRQRLEVLERYLDVLLADLAFARFNEAMAVAYIQFDRASDRRDLGQVSDLRVLELEMVYEEILQSRAGSELAQQLTRTLLASALNRPGKLPRDLVGPRLPERPEPMPDVDSALAAAQAGNAWIRGLLQEGDDNVRRLLLLTLRLRLEELLLRSRALDAAARQVVTEAAYRDLALDQSRALYEQEVTADLGYAMSRQTMTRLRERRIDYCRALTWAELNALMGKSEEKLEARSLK